MLAAADRLVLVAGLVVADEGSLVAVLIDLPERLRLRVAQVLVAIDLDLGERVIDGGRLGDRLDLLLGRGRRGRRLGRRGDGRGRGRLLRLGGLLEVGGRHLLRRGRGRGRRSRRGRGGVGGRRASRGDELSDEGIEGGLVLVDDALCRGQVLDTCRLLLREALLVRDPDLGDVGHARLEEGVGLALLSVRILLLLGGGCLHLGLHGLD